MSGEIKQTHQDVQAHSPSLSKLHSGGNEAAAAINGRVEQGKSTEAGGSSGCCYPAADWTTDRGPGDCATTTLDDAQPAYRSSAVGQNKFECELSYTLPMLCWGLCSILVLSSCGLHVHLPVCLTTRRR